MRSPDEVKAEFVRQWLAKARSDLEMARLVAAGHKTLLFGAGFHAQQAAEKYLKAVLVWRQVEFSKTHDMSELLALVEGVEHGLPPELSEVSTLTMYAVEQRYPGDRPDPTSAQVAAAISVAEGVRAAVLVRLPDEYAKDG